MRHKTVAVLESRLGEQFCELIRKRGGKPFYAPALAEVPDLDLAQIAALVPDLEARPAKAVVFQTGTGTRALFDATDTLALSDRLLALLAPATVVVRGPKPAAVLRARRVRIDLSAKTPFTTHEVLEALRPLPIAGERVLVQRHGAANVELVSALEALGAQVFEIPMYRWSLPQDTRPLLGLIDALDQHQIDAVAFTNAAQAHNLFAVAAQHGRTEALKASLNSTLVASVGPVCSASLRSHGISCRFEANPPKLGALLEVLEKALTA